MRISDWSSDVCSSDLRERRGPLDYRPNAFGRRRRAADPPQPAMAQPSQLREGAALLNGIEALRERARTVLDAATWQYLEAGTDDGISTQWAADARQQLADRKSTRLNSSH